MDTDKGNACVMNVGGTVSYNDIEDDSFKYDNALEIVFDDSDDNVSFVDEKVDNLIDYEDDQKGIDNKKKEHIEEVNGSENEYEELESGCESDEDSGTTKKKYPIFKLQKNLANYKCK